MKKRLSDQNAPDGGAERQAALEGAGNDAASGEAASQDPSNTAPAPNASSPRATKASTGPAKSAKRRARTVKHDVAELEPKEQSLVKKLLTEGSTFEDVVEAVNARGGDKITLNAVQNFYQGNRDIQKDRVRYLIQSAEELLASVDKDPKSAEAQLAKATFLTGYARVHRDTGEITAREAARYRLENENLALKRQILTMNRKKAAQELEYSRARTNLIQLTQGKLQTELRILEGQVRTHQPGMPLGPEVLAKIQEIYGLTCQPLLYTENPDVPSKA